MVIYLLLNLFDTLLTYSFGFIPIIETPAWLVANLPKIFSMVFAFNEYLPIYESFRVVVVLITWTMSYKISKIVLNKAGLDISKS